MLVDVVVGRRTGEEQLRYDARVWLEGLLQLPRMPMLRTRAIARAAVVDCLRDERIELARFVAGWMEPDTQAALRAMLARIGK